MDRLTELQLLNLRRWAMGKRDDDWRDWVETRELLVLIEMAEEHQGCEDPWDE